MLYDGAVNFLNKAIAFADAGDIKNKCIYANKARDIIEELNNSLNTDVGEDMAQELRRLYFFMNRHLMKANWNNDTQGMKEVIEILSGLREAWQTVYTQQENEGHHVIPPQRPAVGLRA